MFLLLPRRGAIDFKANGEGMGDFKPKGEGTERGGRGEAAICLFRSKKEEEGGINGDGCLDREGEGGEKRPLVTLRSNMERRKRQQIWVFMAPPPRGRTTTSP